MSGARSKYLRRGENLVREAGREAGTKNFMLLPHRCGNCLIM